jgi:hypothetical protein
MLLAFAVPAFAQAEHGAALSQAESCSGDNGGIALPPGFCATVFANNIGHARHLVVANTSNEASPQTDEACRVRLP